MSTDSGVSDLIRQFQTRRLESDPGDAFLFQPSKDPVRPVTPARSLDRAPFVPAPVQPAPAARSVERARAPKHRPAPVALAPARSLDRASRASATSYPDAPRDVVWPWIAATLVAGVLGLFGASYLWRAVEGDDASPSASVTPASIVPSDPIAAFTAPPVPQPVVAPAPAPSPAAAAATNTLAVDAVVPPIAAPSTDPAASSTPPKKLHRRHAKTKRVNAKHAKTR
jgi:hypothetical protein